MSKGKKIGYRRTTQEQLNFYVAFLRNHPELMATKKNSANAANVQDLWQEIADNLNAMKGPTRSALKWKDAMIHWRNQFRSRTRKGHKTSTKEHLNSTVHTLFDGTNNDYTYTVTELPTLGLNEMIYDNAENSRTLLDLEDIIPKEVENSPLQTSDFQEIIPKEEIEEDSAFEFGLTKVEQESDMDFAKDIEQEPSNEFTKTQQLKNSNMTNTSGEQASLTPVDRLFLATEPTITPAMEVRKKCTTTNVLQNIVALIEKREQWEQKYREDSLETKKSLSLALTTLGEGMKSMGEAIKSLNESLLLTKQSSAK